MPACLFDGSGPDFCTRSCGLNALGSIHRSSADFALMWCCTEIRTDPDEEMTDIGQVLQELEELKEAQDEPSNQ